MLDDMDKLVSLCKRRGFIFPSSEIYGGINGFWDYGPLGVELKRNIKEAWWRDNVRMRDDMVGLDCSIIMNPRVWEASGHVGGFSDPMVDCRATKERYRADQLFVFAYVFPAVNHKGEPTEAWLAGLGGSPEEAAELPEKKAAKLAKRFGQPAAPPSVIPYMQLDPNDRDKVIGPSTDDRGTLTEPRAFNLMFKTFVGALENESNVAYLRPETAQGIFANFKNVVDTGRVKLPFGIAQIGKSFRNEINPRNFTFRSREFEQMGSRHGEARRAGRRAQAGQSNPCLRASQSQSIPAVSATSDSQGSRRRQEKFLDQAGSRMPKKATSPRTPAPSASSA